MDRQNLPPQNLKLPRLKSSIEYLTSHVGFASNLGSAPLGADLARAVEQPGIFGSNGAQAQVFSLYTQRNRRWCLPQASLDKLHIRGHGLDILRM